MPVYFRIALFAADADRLAAVHDALGRSEFAAGRYHSAQKNFQTALRTPGQSSASMGAVLANAGQAAFALEEYSAAEDLTRRAAALAPDRPGLWQQLGQVLIVRGKNDEAEVTLLRALSLCGAAAVLSDLGELALRRKQMGKAMEYFSWAEVLSARGAERARILTNLERILWAYCEALARVGRKGEAHEAVRRAEFIRSAFAGQTNSLGESVSVRDLRR